MAAGAVSERKENIGAGRRTEACTVLVSISEIREGGLYGHILHGSLKAPVPYQGTCDLVLKLDAVSRRFGPAGPAWEYRFLRDGLAGKEGLLPAECREEVPEDRRMKSGWGSEFYHLGTKETLYLQIAGRQNYTLQGRIRGKLTGGNYVCFRSGMELMQLLSTIPDTNKIKSAKTSRRGEEK